MGSSFENQKSKRTVQDIEMERDHLENQIASLEREHAETLKHEQMDRDASNAAYALRSTYLAYVDAGFTEDQAFELVAIQVGKVARS